MLAPTTTWVRKLFRTECKWDNILFSTINQEKFAMIRRFKTCKIRVFTTVIFPMTVRFLFDHILNSFFICKILSFEKSLNEALLELDWYAKLSGLNINYTKTQIVWIGSKKYSNDTRSTQKLIFPMTVRFLFDHILISFFICKILSF
jgi:hypothetical protein